MKISDNADEELSQLSESRKERGEIIKTKQDIIAQLVKIAHRKELRPLIRG